MGNRRTYKSGLEEVIKLLDFHLNNWKGYEDTMRYLGPPPSASEYAKTWLEQIKTHIEYKIGQVK